MADVLTDAIEDDIADLPGVARVRAALLGHSDTPRVLLRVRTAPGTDLAVLKERIAGDAVDAARGALESPELPAQVLLHVSSPRPRADHLTVSTTLPTALRSSSDARARAASSSANCAPTIGSIRPSASIGSSSVHCCAR